ncbi:MAG: HTH domain-containing protein [Clostridiales bacterium]|nr:HTH domain-containing protein [Clostridiales bacterium]
MKLNNKIRILRISNELIDGGEIGLQELAEEFGVTQMTIKRDIKLIREYLSLYNKEGNAIAFNEKSQKYYLIKPEREWTTKAEALSLAKDLIGLNKYPDDDLAEILHKMISQVDPDERDEARKTITEMYENK